MNVLLIGKSATFDQGVVYLGISTGQTVAYLGQMIKQVIDRHFLMI